MINYLNQATQSLNIAADIIGRENSTLAGLLRTVAAAFGVHADMLMRMMSRSVHPKTGERFTVTQAPRMPRPILSDDSLSEAVGCLQEFANAQKALSALSDTAFACPSTDDKAKVERIKDGARTAALLLERVVYILENGDNGPYYCTNCLERHERREECACGMSQAFVTPLLS